MTTPQELLRREHIHQRAAVLRAQLRTANAKADEAAAKYHSVSEELAREWAHDAAGLRVAHREDHDILDAKAAWAFWNAQAIRFASTLTVELLAVQVAGG